MSSEGSPVSADETLRLAALASYEVLDSGFDQELDDVVRLAAALCTTPISTITFVDSHRQWFKARVGLSFQETSRDIAFCAHTISHKQEFVVADATKDARFRDNPLVTGATHLRFYAGIPLLSREGNAVGTLTVMDTRPRSLTGDQIFALRVLARQTERWLELRRRVIEHSNDLERAITARMDAEHLYRTLWETTTDTVVISDATGTIRFASPSVLELLGYRPEQLVGQPLAVLQPVRYRAAHKHGFERYLKTGEKHLNWRSTEISAVRKDGSEFPVEISFSEISQAGERMFVGFFRDITQRKRTEQALFEQKEHAQATLKAIDDAVVVLDEGGLVDYMNPVAEALTLWSSRDARGRGHQDVLAFADGDGLATFGYGALPDDALVAIPLPGTDLQLRRRSAPAICVEGSVTRLSDREGRRAGSVLVFRDVTSRRRLEAQLSHQAAHDSLTGLLNRGEFERRLLAASEQQVSGESSNAMLYLDLDQFKVVNDTSGHVAGDELIKQIGAILKLHLRSTDTLARLGGDEFGLLLEHCPADRAIQIAETLRKAVAEHPFQWGDRVFGITTSIGHVHFSGASLVPSEVMSKADEACYMAKDLGRNRVHSYRSGDAELARRHGEMEWVALTRQALREGNFVLFSQDIFALSDTDCGRHQEILLRMRGASGELIPPMAFIPAAERYNLMPAIDRWVINSVLTILSARLREDASTVLGCYAINLSGASVSDAHLADDIVAALDATGVPGSCLCFEITETAAIGNLAHAILLMEQLKARGCLFSLDDFGSGMSSFSYLKKLPVDYLKIDGAFIRDIASDPIDRAMVAAIHQIGKLMGLKTVAEFVEDDQILAEVRAIGIDYGQGYGLARPVPF